MINQKSVMFYPQSTIEVAIYIYRDFVVEYPINLPVTTLSVENATIETSRFIIETAGISLTGDNLTKLKEEIKYHLKKNLNRQ